MLLLTRYEGEWIQVGPEIRLYVAEIRDDQVRLGIEAPPSVVILREELLHRNKVQPREK